MMAAAPAGEQAAQSGRDAAERGMFSRKGSRMKAAGGMALTALCAAGFLLVAQLPMNADVAWYIQATRQWAAGQALYLEIGDVNLPSVYLLNRLAYEIATFFGPLGQGQGEYLALLALFFLLVLGVSAFADRLLRDLPDLSPIVRRTLVFGLPAIATLAALGDFLERDHWMLPALLPHALCLYRLQLGKPAPLRLSTAAAVLAAVAALLKPYFLIPYLLLEAYLALRRRDLYLPLRPENFISGGVYLAGMGAMVLAFPAYFTEVLPLAQDAYRAYAYHWFVGFARSDVFLPCGLSLLLLLLAGRAAPKAAAELARMVFALALAFAASYLAQKKGWYYQFVPALACAVLGGAVLLTAALCEELLPRLRRGPAALLSGRGLLAALAAGLAFLLPLHLAYLTQLDLRTRGTYSADVVTLAEILSEAPDAGYLNLSTAINPAFPAATLAHAHWVYGQSTLWALPVHYQPRYTGGKTVPPRPPAKQSRDERAFFDGVVEAFTTGRPRVVTVYRGVAPLMRRDFDFLAYFLQDPAFAEAWEDYAPAGRIAQHEVYIRKSL
jgi:hypothetical protein